MEGMSNIIQLIDSGDIEFVSTNPSYPFSRDEQIGNDSVDLRLGEYFYVIQDKYEYINTLNCELAFSNDVFEKKSFSSEGYLLKPNEIIFAPTLERVKMGSSRYYGYVNGRSLFARFGLSVNCTFTKHGYGMDAIVSLQIKNNGPIALRIYPRQKIAQMEIHNINGHIQRYRGAFHAEIEYMLPSTKESELKQYSENEIAVIKGLRPKKIRELKHDPNIKQIDKYFKVKNIITGIFGTGGFFSFLFLIFENNNPFYFIIMLFSILCITDFIYSTAILSLGRDKHE